MHRNKTKVKEHREGMIDFKESITSSYNENLVVTDSMMSEIMIDCDSRKLLLK